MDRMRKPGPIDIASLSYPLPDDRIARHPLPQRDESLLLHFEHGDISHTHFRNLPDILKPNDLLIFNNTRVIQARLEFLKETGARIEVFCLEPVDPVEYQVSFAQTQSCQWRCLLGNAKKWKQGTLSLAVQIEKDTVQLFASVIRKEKDTAIIEFSWHHHRITFAEILESVGKTPIPPYLKRSPEPGDKDRYQTIYSRFDGSVAAPTAGLHFTDPVMDTLQSKGIGRAHLTLHVGAGTFTPVKESDASDHRMHAETVIVKRSTIAQLLDHKGRIVAVGTTSTRSLESLFWLGIKAGLGSLHPDHIELSQWESYNIMESGDRESVLENLIRFMDLHQLDYLSFQTRIMIVPGYRFQVIDGLITNYHQPHSTLLLLIAAFIGDRWKDVYNYALSNGFRFLSYGDSSILFPSAAH